MEKLWTGRFSEQLDTTADDFNSSLPFDKRMYEEDITGSMAHAAMLAAKGIISFLDSDKIINSLEGILKDIKSGKLIMNDGEDIHMFIETELTKRIGDSGKKLHTARSRNDQVALDIRLYLRKETDIIIEQLKDLIKAILIKVKQNKTTVMPGYTHLQRAQPITFGHHLLAYAFMFLRDIDRLKDMKKRMNLSPLGSCALAGTTYDTDREMVAEKLGFDGVVLNSIDGVSDRDFCIEMASALSLVMMHISRLSEEIILWASFEFKFIELSDAFSTGSSIMPQKKNPDMAELARGKTGRVYGNLVALLTTLKALPLAYNKDMQEDKEAIFDSIDSVKQVLKVFAPMIESMTVLDKNMRAAAAGGFINATDVADYLVKKGLPFRTAYKIVGKLVALCIDNNTTLEELPIGTYQKYSNLFEDDLYTAINIDNCVKKRTSLGGPSIESIENQIKAVEKEL
jgi:argininosuccinate lyase